MDTQTEPVAWLEGADGVRVAVRGTCSLGRSPSNQVVVSDDRVSRRHAMIHAQGKDEYWLVDLGSRNGTYLNGRRVSQPCELADQDRVELGSQSYVFRHIRRPSTAVEPPKETEKTVQDIRSMECWLLVADIEGFTELGKSLPPEEAPRVTGRWLSACQEIIESHRGTINKFLGDGFLAYWPESAEVTSAVTKAVRALRALQAKAAPRFRVVLHQGKVYCGGGGSLGEESLLGNEVNFVFRMEKLAAALKRDCLASQAAQERLVDLLSWGEVGRHPLPGFDRDFPFFEYR